MKPPSSAVVTRMSSKRPLSTGLSFGLGASKLDAT
jgi:hypothetical protein